MTTSRTPTASASKDRSASKAPSLRLACALALGTALTPVTVAAQNLPTGGTVAAGSATIATPTPNTMTINQSSDRAIVNWDGFSIGQGSRVDINQPSASSAILNRVTGDTTSQIHGQLNANGRVFVVNPNGIFIGATGSVNTGSFVASTLNIRNDDFITGQLVFEGDGSSSVVENAGQVQVVSGGYAALIGGKVKNSGTIQAPLGFVGLGAGERITLDLAGDGFLQVAIPTDTDDDGLEALIENSGTIQANGGTVQMSAATARNAARHAINMSGVVEARTVSGRNGRVTLGGGGGGKVSVSGKVRTKTIRRTRPAIQVTQSARPAARPERGGDITITGREISLAGAEIDASGINGGGTVRIGGAFQGGPELPTALTLDIDPGSVINANAIDNGDGGRIILWSDADTVFNGSATARGGELGGDGGFVEVSGKINLTYAGFVDASAPNGQGGELLLDPTDIEIVSVVSGPNQILNTDLQDDLDLMSVTIATSGAGATFPDAGEPGIITVDAPVTWSSGNFLALAADAAIAVNEAITAPNGAFSMFVSIGGAITIDAPIFIPNGDLLIASLFPSGAPGSIIAGIDAAIDTAAFRLLGGNFVQNVSALPDFDAGNFVISPGASFLRAQGGDGLPGATAYDIRDVYGLQGIGTLGGSSAFQLGSDIDASFTSDWFSLAAPVNGEVDQGFVPYPLSAGGLNGNGFTISDLFIRRYGETGGGGTAGLFSVIGSTASVGLLNIENADVAGTAVGILAAQNSGLVLGVSTEGSVTVFNEFSGSTFGGGLVGVNIGDIGGIITDVTITDADDPSATVLGPSESHFVGGIVGNSDGNILASRSSGDISYDNAQVGYVGGIAGSSENDIEDSYSDATVSANTLNGTSAHVGSITGRNIGVIARTIATGPVSITGGNLTGGVGAVTGTDDASDISVISSFFSVVGTGQSTAGTVGENPGTGPGIGTYFEGAIPDAEVNPGDSFVALTDAEPFSFLALVGGNWDFENIWAYPQDGVDQARLFSVDPVINAVDFNDPAPTITYGGADPGFTGIAPEFFGGPGNYFFGPLGDSGDLTVLSDGIVLSSPDVGSRTYTFPTTYTSDLGQVFDVRSFDFDIEITPAPINITVNDFDKSYGDEFTAADVSFTSDPFFDADGITSFVADSAGGPAEVEVSDTVFAIELSDIEGVGLANYAISVTGGSLRVVPRSLDVIIDDRDKPYGTAIVFDGTEFTTTGLVNGDTVTSLTLFSDGATAEASAADNPFDINGEDVIGTGLSNYTLTIVPGTLTVVPATLTVTIDDQSKPYGDVFVFDGTEFSTTGLVAGDSVTSLTITSDGAPASASAADSPFDITGTDPVGTGIENYTLAIEPGALTVVPAALTITLDDQTKGYGDELLFDGSEFTTIGLVNGDTVTSLTITSDGAAPTAQVADGPFDINGEAPVGTGVENYDVTFSPGALTLTPAPLTITADDIAKPFGTAFTFEGTEFSVTGLLNADSVDSATLTSDGASPDAPLTGEAGVAVLITDPTGTGLDNYNITLVGGVLVIAPGNLVITANDQTKTYGDTFTFAGTEFTVAGLAEGDSVDSITLTSAGAEGSAQVTGSPFVITGSDAVGTGLEQYTITFADGTFTVVPAPLTITANDQIKQEGTLFTFGGTEYATSGLRNGDTVDAATLFSAGAAEEALADDSPFAITVNDVSGTGLDNYDIAAVDGAFTVSNLINTPEVNPVPSITPRIDSGTDSITIALPAFDGTTRVIGTGVQSTPTDTGGPQQSLGDAETTLAVVDTISTELELQVQSCGNAEQDFTNYMTCLSESLDTYSNALDDITNDLPSGLETVSATIRTAADEVRAAAARAQARLATATNDTQRRAIQRQAIAEARGAIDTAKQEIRKAITLIRADDPEVQAVQQQTGARIVAAFDTVDSALARATDL